MHTLLEMRDRSLMLSLDSALFWDIRKGLKGFKPWDPKANKVVISKDVIFDKKVMLQAPKNH